MKEITNDIELTKQRQDDIKVNGKLQGLWDGNYKAFFTKIGMERYIETNKIRRYKYKLLHVDDVREVRYEV